CADACTRVECAHAGATCPQALGERTLRHDFQLNLTRIVQLMEGAQIGRARERTDHFAHASAADQGGKPDIACPGIVVDDDQVLRTMIDQGVDQFDGCTRSAEAAYQNGGSIVNLCDRFSSGSDVFHLWTITFTVRGNALSR